jgi:hypothetical protein
VLDEHAMSADPGIDHRNVDPAEQRFRALHACESLVANCNIARDHVSFRTRGSQTIRQCFERVFATGRENEPRTLASCVLRDGAPNARRSARDQDRSTAQTA